MWRGESDAITEEFAGELVSTSPVFRAIDVGEIPDVGALDPDRQSVVVEGMLMKFTISSDILCQADMVSRYWTVASLVSSDLAENFCNPISGPSNTLTRFP